MYRTHEKKVAGFISCWVLRESWSFLVLLEECDVAGVFVGSFKAGEGYSIPGCQSGWYDLLGLLSINTSSIVVVAMYTG